MIGTGSTRTVDAEGGKGSMEREIQQQLHLDFP